MGQTRVNFTVHTYLYRVTFWTHLTKSHHLSSNAAYFIARFAPIRRSLPSDLWSDTNDRKRLIFSCYLLKDQHHISVLNVVTDLCVDTTYDDIQKRFMESHLP